MSMMKRIAHRYLLLFIFNSAFLIFNSASAQDSSRLRISLLTCTPGEELYSTFGHSAYRVIDSNSVTDIVYNYGTFNFDDDGCKWLEIREMGIMESGRRMTVGKSEADKAYSIG